MDHATVQNPQPHRVVLREGIVERYELELGTYAPTSLTDTRYLDLFGRLSGRSVLIRWICFQVCGPYLRESSR